MPDLLTPQALATAGPLVLETFFKHYLSPKTARGENKAREDLLYDEAFILMKTFLEIATKYPVAALQRFGLVRTPAPPWVALHRLIIPQRTLAESAEYMVKALGGEDMAYKIAGGTKWWQVRAGPGVEAEWIVMKKDWKELSKKEREKEKEKEKHKEKGAKQNELPSDKEEQGDNGEFRKEMDELRCMLYIHGGAYYWGSINTHRYTIWRYARKMHGRCFAVNYRKAPQYPFPCAIQDCLAAWLYLVKPPPGAEHKPVDPKNIVIAGDSAGGGLVWALLQILRDTEGLELPAGAVLISPWSDLTHSFPSILKNTATDIVPPYGFIHKPSSLWPPPPPALTEEIQSRLRSRVKEAVSRIRDPHTNTQRRASTSSQTSITSPVIQKQTIPDQLRSSSPNHATGTPEKKDKRDLHPISEKKGGGEADHPGPTGEIHHNPSRANPGILFSTLKHRDEETNTSMTTLSQCHTPLHLQVEDKEVLIDTQIQLYATNAQLCHPWVSPVLGYLGGLPPLLIIAGDKEVLRDEIIYVAHKAAHPEDHPIRDDVRAMLPSLKDIEERSAPTNVHLQVYDGSCHDLPLFSMTKVSRGVFRAISSFARYVTPSAPGSLSISRSRFNSPYASGSSTPVTAAYDRRPSDEDPSTILTAPVTSTPPFVTPATSLTALDTAFVPAQEETGITDSPRTLSASSSGPEKSRPSSINNVRFSQLALTPAAGREQSAGGSIRPSPDDAPKSGSGPSGDDAGPRFGDDPADKDSRALPGTAGHSGVYKGDKPFTDHMIRERVATDGTCRPLEAPSDLPAMTMPEDEVGVIKEGPAIRYLNGQSLWDKKYSHAIRSVERHRKRNLKDAKERDTRKITKMWTEKVKSHQKERERKLAEDELVEAGRANGMERAVMDDPHTQTHTPNSNSNSNPGSGWETEYETDRESVIHFNGEPKILKTTSKSQEERTRAEQDLMDQSWSWSWALQGEAPPPSAIVSRRDFGEARQLALMADRMDTSHESPVHGLSIWVGLAAFFSNSSERNKAHDALKKIQDERKAEKAGRGTVPGQVAVGHAGVHKLEKGVEEVEKGLGGTFRKMSRIFGKKK